MKYLKNFKNPVPIRIWHLTPLKRFLPRNILKIQFIFKITANKSEVVMREDLATDVRYKKINDIRLLGSFS